jgi:hypothetical protein
MPVLNEFGGFTSSINGNPFLVTLHQHIWNKTQCYPIRYTMTYSGAFIAVFVIDGCENYRSAEIHEIQFLESIVPEFEIK